MKEIIINITEVCGEDRISREAGANLRNLILDKWDEFNRIVIDFDNLLVASASFLDEAVAKLAFEFNEEDIKKKIKLENIEPFDKALVNDLIIRRLNKTDKNSELEKYLATKKKGQNPTHKSE